MSNFLFLKEKWPLLENIATLAEKNLYLDANTTLFKSRLFGENLVTYILTEEHIVVDEKEPYYRKIDKLKKEDYITDEIERILHVMRKEGNKAAHIGYNDEKVALTHLTLMHKLANWLMCTYGDWNFEPQKFVVPPQPTNETYDKVIIEKQEAAYQKLEAESKAKIAELEAQLKATTLSNEEKAAFDKASQQRRKRTKEVSSKFNYTEAETRLIIDTALRAAGWEADTETIRYSKGARPEKNKNKAIAEWPTDSKSRKYGKADYALFIGEKLVGVIEAKRYSHDVAGNMIEAKNYAQQIREADNKYVANKWGDYQVPFLFTTNGRGYIKEIPEKSGIHFLDCRNPKNHTQILRGWLSPQNIKELLSKDIEASNQELTHMNYDFMTSPDGLGLRYYQIAAIKAVEKAIQEDKKSALLAMATGTGKTRTILGMIYRLLKAKRFNRILFLVDRTALGHQAKDTFNDVKLEDLMSLNSLYNINGLEDKVISAETKVQIATVQSMMSRIFGSDTENKPNVGDFDCIIIDEAHRGYTLDKEMSELEVEYRDSSDFVSKYKRVIEYFEAFKIALTATPALHTTKIFGMPVYQYTYRQAVIDGFLVDHNPPEVIKTKLLEEGIHLKKGDKVAKIDRYTNELINGAELEDDLDFEIDAFNKKIIVESHTREALREVIKRLDPDDDKGKTLIFAATEMHADMIVRVLKELFEEDDRPVDDDAILKITGTIKDQDLAISRFKNETYPNIVVTVDLLTTGVDVPKINKLVFLRRVKSRILYEQMVGRATRLCPEIQKDHFDIYDCVNLYEAMEDITNMKPVVAGVATRFKDLVDLIKVSQDENEIKQLVNKVIAKLQRKKRNIAENYQGEITALTNGKTIEDIICTLKEDDKAILDILSNDVITLLDSDLSDKSQHYMILSDKEDKLISHTKGYGKNESPKDYLESFHEFINDNRNKYTALEVVLTRPQDLTRQSLKEVLAILSNHDFNEKYLQTAWKDLKNEEIAADIIAFIRQKSLGDPLETTEERVKKAIAKLKKERSFNAAQEKWLRQIEKVMIKDMILDQETLNLGAFKTQGGGYDNLNKKIFKGELGTIISKLKSYLFDREIS